MYKTRFELLATFIRRVTAWESRKLADGGGEGRFISLNQPNGGRKKAKLVTRKVLWENHVCPNHGAIYPPTMMEQKGLPNGQGADNGC